jgi:hypothetical protein
MLQAIEFLTIEGFVLVGFISTLGYVAIDSFENEICGIWKENEIVYSNELTRPIFYRTGEGLN